MRTLVSGRLMKEIDRRTIHEIGVPSLVLMERAALAVAREAKNGFGCENGEIWAVCGPGNNGADAAAAGRILSLWGFPVRILLAGSAESDSMTGELKLQLSIAGKLGIPVSSWREVTQERVCVVIDGIFGVGLSRPVGGEYRLCMEWLAGIQKEKKPFVVSVDLPSGIHSDTGKVMGIALQADCTVTFGWEKMGTAIYPGRSMAGRVITEEIGFPAGMLYEAAREMEPEEGIVLAGVWEESDLKQQIPERKADSNKGSFGKVLIVAGSRNMSGAAYLSALAAYRTGAGLVKILTPEENRAVLQTLLPEAILASYTPGQPMEGREAFKKMIEEEMNWADVVVLGPGLGQEEYVEYLVEDILASAFVPVILDADALNTIAAHPYLTGYYTENIIITPHPGEMARLTGQTVSELKHDLPSAARAYAAHYGITCVLKDAATVVAGREGELWLNTRGCSAMAKAGSGDVLTGVIAGLLALGLDEEKAASVGVFIHSLAGERAAAGGAHSLLASELASGLAEVLKDAIG